MKISTEIWSSANILGEERAIYELAKAGFDAWDFSMFEMCRIDWRDYSVIDKPHPLNQNDYLKFARRLKQIGLDNGIICNQSHAPFPSKVPSISDIYLKRAIECTAEAGGKICIIHPDNNATAEENAEFYHNYLPFAKECGVKIATENMWNWENGAPTACAAACSHHDDFCKHVDLINDEDFVACLDIGHAEMAGLNTSAPTMIRALDKRLQALHIHDNDKLGDSHQIPFSMNIDWAPIAKALKDIDYKGELTLEADRHLNSFSKENVFEGVCELARSARRFEELIKKA